MAGRQLDDLTQEEKAKLVNKVLDRKNGIIADDWGEIAREFGLSINSNTLRKAATGVRLVDEAGLLNECGDLSGGYVERQKLRDLTRKVNEMYRTESRSELLRETVFEAVRSLQRYYPPVMMDRPYCKAEDRCLVVAAGDFHYGADIHVRGLMGEVINDYDHKVFEERMWKLRSEIIAILEKEDLNYIHVCLVGDLLDGILRQSQLMRLEYGLVESTMKLAEFMAGWLNSLSSFAFVEVHAVMGNHSEVRPLKSKNREFEEENLEKIIMWFLKARLEDNANIYVDEDCSMQKFIDIKGYKFLLLHGDGDKNISSIAQEAVNMYAKPIDFFICGHTHSEREYPMGVTDGGSSVIVRVPSLCGIDKYAQSRGYRSEPGAIAMVIERGYGRRCVYPIRL